ncbi:response regulator [bacterium]|nr:response regulator [bacterium]
MGDRLSILLVDDEKDFLSITVRMLENLEYDVECALSGSEALHMYKKKGFDLLITDLKMPVMDGFELIHKIRAINPQQKIIVSTAFQMQAVPWNKRFECSDTPGEGVNMSSINFIFKPYTKSSLVSAIDSTLRGEVFAPKCDIISKPLAENPSKESLKNPPLDCFYFIDLYSIGKKSVCLCVRLGERSGRIYILEGDVVHAETLSLNGKEALLEILSWNAPEVSLAQVPSGIKRSIESPIQALLPEGRRRTLSQKGLNAGKKGTLLPVLTSRKCMPRTVE